LTEQRLAERAPRAVSSAARPLGPGGKAIARGAWRVIGRGAFRGTSTWSAGATDAIFEIASVTKVFTATVLADFATSTASDLLRFVRAQVQTDHPLAATFERARSQRWQGRSFGLGLGWFLSQLGPNTEVWHTGGSNGFSSYAGFVPTCEVGAVVLIDHGPSLWDAFVRNPVDHAARQLLRALVAET
jgi:CubicO group peptidase (beta-lactamase class C family)